MTPRPLIVQWPGASGRWYAHTVFPWDLLPDVENANFILVAARGKDAGLPLFIGASEALTRELPLRPEWSAAQMHGLTHVHVHLLAADARERETIRADLVACVETPFNCEAWGVAGGPGTIQMAPGRAVPVAPGGAVPLAPGGAVPLAPSGAVRWMGGRQPSQQATRLGRDFVLPQAAAVRRAG